jgi:hypothetical protein
VPSKPQCPPSRSALQAAEPPSRRTLQAAEPSKPLSPPSR